jgi:hypothetical protein
VSRHLPHRHHFLADRALGVSSPTLLLVTLQLSLWAWFAAVLTGHRSPNTSILMVFEFVPIAFLCTVPTLFLFVQLFLGRSIGT